MPAPNADPPDHSPQEVSPARWHAAAVPPAVLTALLVTALVSCLVLIGSELAFNRLSSTQARSASLVDARVGLINLQLEVGQAESAQRGYLITSEARYLKPFESASALATFHFGVVMNKLGDFPALSQSASSVGALLKTRQDELALTVHLAMSGQREAALRLLRTDRGIAVMEQLVQVIKALDQQILDETRTIDARMRSLAQRQRFGVGGLVCLNLVFLAALAARTIRHFREREAQRAELARQASLLEATVAERTRELADLSTYLQEQSERERAQLARNLHDELGALLTAAKLDVAWLQGRNPGTDAMRTEHLERLAAQLDQAVDLKRLVIENLRPSVLEQLGLSAAVSWYVDESCRRAGLQCDAQVAEVDVGQAEALTLYRIIQEAMTNTIRHADARQVRLSLSASEDETVLSISDDGRGMNLDARQGQVGGHGLQGMAHRVRSHHGHLDIRSSPGQGTTLTVRIPKGKPPAPSSEAATVVS